eukprot:gene55641-40592_t
MRNCPSGSSSCVVRCRGDRACVSEDATVCDHIGHPMHGGLLGTALLGFCSVVPQGAMCYGDSSGDHGCWGSTNNGGFADAPSPASLPCVATTTV